MMRRKQPIVFTSCIFTVFLMIFAVTACSKNIAGEADDSDISRSTEVLSSSNILTPAQTLEPTEEGTTSAELTEATSKEPMNPISSNDFIGILEDLGYSTRDKNYEGSGLLESWFGYDSKYTCNFFYQKYETVEGAKDAFDGFYDNLINGEGDASFEGDVIPSDSDDYNMVVANGQDNSGPLYEVFIQVDDVLIQAYVFSTDAEDIAKINAFVSELGYL